MHKGLLAALMVTGIVTSAHAEIGRGDRYTAAPWATRSPVLAQHGMVASEQPLASEAAAARWTQPSPPTP